MIWPFRSSTFFSCSKCGRSDSDTSKRVTLSSGTMVYSYVSWISERWLHDFNRVWIYEVCLSMTFCQHELWYHLCHHFYSRIEMHLLKFDLVIFGRHNIRIHLATPLGKTDRNHCQKRPFNGFIRNVQLWWFWCCAFFFSWW